MWVRLNSTFLPTLFHSRSPPSLLGPCNKKCAQAHWKSLGSTSGAGPICGVPGCTAPGPPAGNKVITKGYLL